jgi:hypothetical protein
MNRKNRKKFNPAQRLINCFADGFWGRSWGEVEKLRGGEDFWFENSKFGGLKFEEPLRCEGAKQTFSVERRLVSR